MSRILKAILGSGVALMFCSVCTADTITVDMEGNGDTADRGNADLTFARRRLRVS